MPFLASSSAASLPRGPLCPLIHCRVTWLYVYLRERFVAFRISKGIRYIRTHDTRVGEETRKDNNQKCVREDKSCWGMQERSNRKKGLRG